MQITTRDQPIRRQTANILPLRDHGIDGQDAIPRFHDGEHLTDHLDAVRVRPVVEYEAEDVDGGVGDGLWGEDIVRVEGDARFQGSGEKSVELGFKIREILDDAADLGIVEGDFGGEVTDGTAELVKDTS